MGVVHVLLAALMSITYGWESDGNGGVQYIVQVSPEELQEISRLGEISSTIDPKIAGDVSRISIRVGSSALPRETPTHLLQKNHQGSARQVAADSDSVAVPTLENSEQEMLDLNRAAPLPALDAHTNQRSDGMLAGSPPTAAEPRTEVMMKPDPDGGSGPGFAFPSIGNSADQASQGIQNNIDQAGREIVGRGQSMLENLKQKASSTVRNAATDAANNFRVPPPATRTATSPPFTDSRSTNSSFSGTGYDNRTFSPPVGGPTTDPVAARDQSWNEFAGRRPGGPTTDAVTTDRIGRLETMNAGTQNQTAAGNRSTGVTSADTFGQTPRGMSFPTRTSGSNDFSNRDLSGVQYGSTDRYGLDSVMSQQQQMELDRSQGQTSPQDLNRTQLPSLSHPSAPSPPNANEFASNDGLRSMNASTNNTLVAESTSGPDRRLTATELAAGAWSIDRYGRLLDRFGRLVPVEQRDSQVDPRLTTDRRVDLPQSSAILEQPQVSRAGADTHFVRETNPIQPGQYQPGATQPGTFQQQDRISQQPYQPYQPASAHPYQGQMVPIGGDRGVDSQTTLDRRDPNLDPRSLSDRDRSETDPLVNDTRQRSRNQVAAQPLFNGLLLISFVANIYLMYWLKNLRVRFRDLVAAKRLANSNAQPS